MSGAQNKPIVSYANRTYDKTLTGLASGPRIWGRIVSIKVNVTTPYTGTQPTLMWKFNTGNAAPVRKADGTIKAINLQIDAKVAGERVFTPSGNSNIKPNDVAPTLVAGDTAMGGFFVAAQLTSDVSGESAGPVINLEIICDQGIS